MQTFLPYASFIESAKCLDYRRLGKQRVEAKQIIQAIEKGSGGWFNHPAVQQWIGYVPYLCDYAEEVCGEWISRGYVDNLINWFQNKQEEYLRLGDPYSEPSWLGNEKYHSSHRSNLLRKDPIYYAKFNWAESANLPYYWPSK